MASAIGLSATREVVWAKSYEDEVGSIVEGAVVIHSAADNGKCKLPAAAAADKVCGVNMSAGTSTSGGGDRLDVQKGGIAIVNLVAGGTVVRGSLLIVANSSGDVKAWTNETSCTIVGRSEWAGTAGAAAAKIPCHLLLVDNL